MASATPRFLRHLPHRYVTEGEYRYVELTRPDGPVRLYDFEYALALELDGRPYAEIASAANAKLGMQLDAAQVEQFAASLVEFQLVEPAAPGAPGTGLAPARAASEGQWSAPQGEPTAMMQGMSELLAVATRPAPDSESELDALGDGGRATEPDRAATAAPDGLPGRGAESLPAVAPGPETSAPAAPDSAPARPGLGPDLLAGFDLPLPGAAPSAPGPGEPAALAGAASAQKRGSTWLVWAVLGLIAAAGAVFALWKFVLAPSDDGPVSVRTVTPLPESVYRYFPVHAPVTAPEPVVLRAPGSGTLVELRAAGDEVQAGDLLALLDGGLPARRELATLRERITHYRQLVQALAAEGDEVQRAQAEARLREKEQLAAEQEGLLAQHAVLASGPGRVVEVLAQAGARVRAGQALVRILGPWPQVTWALPVALHAEAARLSFCRVQAVAAAVGCDCRLAPGEPGRDAGGTDRERGDTALLRAELAPDCPLAPGTQVALARVRLDGVFPLPARALVRAGDSERVFVAAPGGRSELRQVLLAEPIPPARGTGEEVAPGADDAAQVLVAQGLDVGDAVIVEASAPLRANARVRVTEPRPR